MITDTQYIRSRARPRISVNKLGEYLAEKNAARREAILRDQKREIRCRVIQYQDAYRAIAKALSGGGDPKESLERHLESAKAWAPGPEDSEFDVREHRLCTDAIRGFMEILPALDLDGLTATYGSNAAPKLRKAGVAISVRPEVVLRGITRRGLPLVGAVKLHFPKSHPLSPDAAEYVGVMLHEFGELHMSGSGVCDHRHCWVVDISTKKAWTAPKSFIRKRSEVEAGCRQIAALWESSSET